MTELSDLAAYQAKDPQQALDAALATVRSYCGWHIAPERAETLIVSSVDGRTLLVSTLRLTELVSATQDAVALDLGDIEFESYGVVRGYFGTGTPVTLEIVHGYDVMPDDVSDIVRALAQRSISDTRGLVSKTIGPFSENYGPKLNDDQKTGLAPYALSSGFA